MEQMYRVPFDRNSAREKYLCDEVEGVGIVQLTMVWQYWFHQHPQFAVHHLHPFFNPIELFQRFVLILHVDGDVTVTTVGIGRKINVFRLQHQSCAALGKFIGGCLSTKLSHDHALAQYHGITPSTLRLKQGVLQMCLKLISVVCDRLKECLMTFLSICV